MTYDPNDPNRPFEYPSLEGYSGPPANPYQPVDYPYPSTYPSSPSGATGYPQFPPPYQGYGASPYDPYATARPQATNGMAIGALVSSLVGLPLCICFIPSVVGIALGIIAMGQTKRTGEQGHGLAVAAVIVGAVTIVLGIGAWILVALAPDDTSSTSY
jgi:hypothetical protein